MYTVPNRKLRVFPIRLGIRSSHPLSTAYRICSRIVRRESPASDAILFWLGNAPVPSIPICLLMVQRTKRVVEVGPLSEQNSSRQRKSTQSEVLFNRRTFAVSSIAGRPMQGSSEQQCDRIPKIGFHLQPRHALDDPVERGAESSQWRLDGRSRIWRAPRPAALVAVEAIAFACLHSRRVY
jgi:hypothetical protein